MDLIDFLKARIDEDEAAAKAANAVDTESVGEWTVVETPLCIPGGRTAIDVTVESSLDWTLCDGIGSGSLSERRGLAEHIARHDPARVLADVAAKRAIVDDYAEVPSTARLRPLRWLAEVWRDHPDYDAEWDIP